MAGPNGATDGRQAWMDLYDNFIASHTGPKFATDIRSVVKTLGTGTPPSGCLLQISREGEVTVAQNVLAGASAGGQY